MPRIGRQIVFGSLSLWFFVGRAHYHLYVIVRSSFDVSFTVIFLRESYTRHDPLPSYYFVTTTGPAASGFSTARRQEDLSSTRTHRLIQSARFVGVSLFLRSILQGSSGRDRAIAPVHPSKSTRTSCLARRMATAFLFHSLGASFNLRPSHFLSLSRETNRIEFRYAGRSEP